MDLPHYVQHLTLIFNLKIFQITWEMQLQIRHRARKFKCNISIACIIEKFVKQPRYKYRSCSAGKYATIVCMQIWSK